MFFFPKERLGEEQLGGGRCCTMSTTAAELTVAHEHLTPYILVMIIAT